MPKTSDARYRDPTGVWHELDVRQTPAGAWQIIDTRVIDTLDGIGDGPRQARAVARDYASQHHHPEPPTGQTACASHQRAPAPAPCGT